MDNSRKKIALLSNVTVDLLIGRMRKKYDFYQPEGFDTWVQEAINPDARIYSEQLDAVVILLDGTEARSWRTIDEGIQRIGLWKQAIVALTTKIKLIPVFISTIDVRENRIKSLSERKSKYALENDWYQFVQGLVESKNNVFLFDMADTITEMGRIQFYSNKMWYMSSMPYSREGLYAVASEIDRVLGSAFEARRKIVALDLDNTIWGGVIGEDGVDGIELSDHKEGQRYYDFQRQFQEMKKRGTVLGIVSKNNEEDAEQAIRNHPNMLLKEEDFVSKKINWENKDVNLRSMQRELNLTEASFVFIDDNPVEREMVKGACPEMLVPDFPTDSTELLKFAEEIWFDYFRPLRVLSEDLKKTQMYQNEVLRNQEMRESINLEDYLEKLEIAVEIHKMRDSELERVVQLINKTNQFNVTTKRYTRADVKEILFDSDNAVYVAYSSDKYGDSGLISVMILKGLKTDIHIDSFLMSCRVMGRKLEDVILNEIAAKYQKKMIGEFVPTAKNKPVSELFDRLGFTLVSNNNGHKIYELEGKGYQKKAFNYYKEIRFEE